MKTDKFKKINALIEESQSTVYSLLYGLETRIDITNENSKDTIKLVQWATNDVWHEFNLLLEKIKEQETI